MIRFSRSCFSVFSSTRGGYVNIDSLFVPGAGMIYTPTFTPTATPTPTNPPLPTPTPDSTFSHASFTYDGDGKRVKSDITTNLGTTTTYFVGNHYEVRDGVVTKYYYTGTQRIAMRDSNDYLYFLLGDHLGSTNLVTFGNGNVVSETRYKAWGEMRYASGNTPTQYQYTGQFSYESQFGLYFYNARWLDVSLGRFAQADSILDNWDRYSYVHDSPLNYTDPSGHCVDADGDGQCERGINYFRQSKPWEQQADILSGPLSEKAEIFIICIGKCIKINLDGGGAL